MVDTQTATAAIQRPLRFCDQEQIAAYDHLERVAELEELLEYLLEGDDTPEHTNALREALLGRGWLESLTKQCTPAIEAKSARRKTA